MFNKRSSGLLLHPTSLPGKYGIGTLGEEAFRFIDFLEKSGQHFWQVLPLGPTGCGDSPYQSLSSFAGNPLLIDPELLLDKGLLLRHDLSSAESENDGSIDFGKLIPEKLALLRKAFGIFSSSTDHHHTPDYIDFLQQEKNWLEDYALFMALKDHFDKPWYQWEKSIKMRDSSVLSGYRSLLAKEIEFQKFIQFQFFIQWFAVKAYSNLHGIRIIGDLPIYVAYDSADVWVHPELFHLDKEFNPVEVAGVPPDYFSETGQLWGNPLYKWKTILEEGGTWWIERFRKNLHLYDAIRLDHFRGFCGYWAVPYGDETAERGKWRKGPGKKLFNLITKELGTVPVVAEDLGVITEDVTALRDSLGFPGMKILQFAFDSDEENDYLPYNLVRNSVLYTGTHDNDTVKGWFDSITAEDRNFLLDYLHSSGEDICWDMIRLAWSSVAHTTIAPLQDLLELGPESRMNLPGSAENNWRWRCSSSQLSEELAEKLFRITELYGRSSRTNHQSPVTNNNLQPENEKE